MKYDPLPDGIDTVVISELFKGHLRDNTGKSIGHVIHTFGAPPWVSLVDIPVSHTNYEMWKAMAGYREWLKNNPGGDLLQYVERGPSWEAMDPVDYQRERRAEWSNQGPLDLLADEQEHDPLADDSMFYEHPEEE